MRESTTFSHKLAANPDPAAHAFDYPKDSTEKAQAEWGYATYADQVTIPGVRSRT